MLVTPLHLQVHPFRFPFPPVAPLVPHTTSDILPLTLLLCSIFRSPPRPRPTPSCSSLASHHTSPGLAAAYRSCASRPPPPPRSSICFLGLSSSPHAVCFWSLSSSCLSICLPACLFPSSPRAPRRGPCSPVWQLPSPSYVYPISYYGFYHTLQRSGLHGDPALDPPLRDSRRLNSLPCRPESSCPALRGPIRKESHSVCFVGFLSSQATARGATTLGEKTGKKVKK